MTNAGSCTAGIRDQGIENENIHSAGPGTGILKVVAAEVGQSDRPFDNTTWQGEIATAILGKPSHAPFKEIL